MKQISFVKMTFFTEHVEVTYKLDIMLREISMGFRERINNAPGVPELREIAEEIQELRDDFGVPLFNLYVPQPRDG